MPSLNVADYMEECILSVRSQSLRDMEIICVDAGSVDGTLEIIRKYMAEDDRIRLITSTRKSYGYQMNLGIKAAAGEYIGIVETDDFIPADMYEELYDAASAENLDFVKADFYRFTTKEDGTYDKRYFHLTTNPDYIKLYNTVIAPKDYPETFYFAMNTWSGIYKRDFLIRHNIWHNETPGASFQDNGFWFQTFMYADRVMFINKPYYMNRRDNPDSSVYHKGKVYSVCDEYEYLYKILEGDRYLYDRFIYIFSKIKYDNYFFNLDRISEEFKLEFIRRIGADFSESRRKKELAGDMFAGERWQALLMMADNPEKYYQQEIMVKKRLVEQLRLFDDVIIYGAGNIGRLMLNLLIYNENPVHVLCFAVTAKSENMDVVLGKPVKEIGELSEYKDTAAVLIGTTEIYQDEIADTLKNFGFKNIFKAPVIEEKDEAYYSKIPAEKIKSELVLWVYENKGIAVDIDNPETLEDFVEWQKLYGIDENLARRIRKGTMPGEVERLIGHEYAPKIYGIYRSFDEIPFQKLPESFVLQCGHSKYEERRVTDIRKFDGMQRAVERRKFDRRIITDFSRISGFNLFLGDSDRKIIVREYPAFQENDIEYNFVCIDGTVEYMYISRAGNGNVGYMYIGSALKGIYSRQGTISKNGAPIPGVKAVCGLQAGTEEAVFTEEMVRAAEQIAEGFKVATVGMYKDGGRVVIDYIDNEAAIIKV